MGPGAGTARGDGGPCKKGSTLSCVDCDGASDDAPLVAGGPTAIVLGLGVAATGATMVVLGF